MEMSKKRTFWIQNMAKSMAKMNKRENTTGTDRQPYCWLWTVRQ